MKDKWRPYRSPMIDLRNRIDALEKEAMKRQPPDAPAPVARAVVTFTKWSVKDDPNFTTKCHYYQDKNRNERFTLDLRPP